MGGADYSNFIGASCTLQLDALSNTFDFEAVAQQGQALPFSGGESCIVSVNGKKVITGNIELINSSYSADTHVITISGRDKTGDLLDTTLGKVSDIRAQGLTLKSLIEKVVSSIGLDIKVISNVDIEPFNSAEDLASAEAGESAFSFIEKYARKRQVMLTSDSDGNIVIDVNSGISATGNLQNILGATNNNILNSSFSYDSTGRYNFYVMQSALNPTILGGSSFDLGSLVAQDGGVLDSAIRKGRQLILVSEAPYSSAQCLERAKWEKNIREARGLRYGATVSGFEAQDGSLWQPNRLYNVTDDFIGKNETMLCNSVTFSYDVSSGSTTALEFVGSNAYTVFVEPKKVKRKNKSNKVSFLTGS